jgi:hypothetical protein
MKKRSLGLVAVLALSLSGCPKNTITAPHPGTTDSLANNAYDVVAAAKGYLISERSQHPECPAATTTVCVIIGQAVGAKDLLIDAITVYCSGPSFLTGGACDPPAAGTPAATQAAAKLQSAITNYNQIAADLKTATGGK